MIKRDILREGEEDHYARLSPQPIEVINAWGLDFNLGNVVKYVARAGHKDDIVKDLKKARAYIDFEIRRLNGEALIRR